MPKLLIQGLQPYDGEYELELSGLTNRDYHRIKQLSGVRAGELPEAMKAGDIGVFVAVTEMILKRNGFPEVNVDALWDAPEDCFQILETAEDAAAEDADRPLDIATPGGNKNEPADDASNNEKKPLSGSNGDTDGDPNPPTPLRTGALGSVMSADFARSTSDD